MEVLIGATERARSGEFSCVIIEGEAGIGKSRLLAETLRSARDDGWAVAYEEGDEVQQLRPFGLVAGALGCVPSARDPRRRTIGELLSTHERGGAGAVTISSDPGLQFRAVDALADLVESLAHEQPLIIGLDDAQWADPSSLLTVSAIARAAIGLPLLLVVCSRPFPRSALLRRTLDSLIDTGARHVKLANLTRDDAQELVAQALKRAPDADESAALEAAGGNPFFLLEMLAGLADDGGRVRKSLTHDTASATLPPSLKQVILRRINPLPAATLSALQAGALLGSHFSITELAAVTGLPVPELVAALEPAITAGILEAGAERLRFCHDIIHDVIYDDVPLGLRIGLHRDAAHRLAEIGADVTLVTEQFSRGAQVGDDDAVGVLAEAASRAMSASPESAAEYLARAAELVPPSDARHDVLLAQRADCLMLAGRVAQAVKQCQGLLERAHSPEADAPARLRLGAALLVNGQPAEALSQLTVVSGAAVDDASLATALSEEATARMWLGDLDGADRVARAAGRVASSGGNHRAMAATMATRSVVACMQARSQDALHLNDEALTIADNSPSRVGHGYPVYATRGWLLMEVDELEKARHALSMGRQICEDLGVRWPLATYQAYFAVERFLAGAWDDAAAELEAGISFAEEEGVTFGLKPSHSALAVIRLHRGDLIGAREEVDEAMAVSDRGSRLFDNRAAWARALVHEADGDRVGALTTLSDSWSTCVEAGMAADYPLLGPDLVRLACSAGQREIAEDVTLAVEGIAASNAIESYTAAALRCRGLLDSDLAKMTRAVETYARASRNVETALTCEEAAGIAIEDGEREAARELLERAWDIFTHLDAVRCLARVDARYRQLGIRRGVRGPRRRPAWGWGSLTPTEAEVAELVAEGLSNPQIAERLFISRRTVQTHVSHAFAKLNIASRAQLAVQVIEHRRRADGHPHRHHQ